MATLTIVNSSCNSPLWCVEYGYLYNWYAASDSRNLASLGYHVPTLQNINDFITYVANQTGASITTDTDYFGTGRDKIIASSAASNALKDATGSYWINSVDASNLFNFNAKGAGYRQYSGNFDRLKAVSIMTTSELPDWSTQWAILMQIEGEGTEDTFSSEERETCGMSVRPFKDSLTTEEQALNDGYAGPNYAGNDGKTYRTVKIGSFIVVADNIIETKYRNGDPIPTVEDATTWEGLSTGAKCAYDNNYNYVGCGVTG